MAAAEKREAVSMGATFRSGETFGNFDIGTRGKKNASATVGAFIRSSRHAGVGTYEGDFLLRDARVNARGAHFRIDDRHRVSVRFVPKRKERRKVCGGELWYGKAVGKIRLRFGNGSGRIVSTEPTRAYRLTGSRSSCGVIVFGKEGEPDGVTLDSCSGDATFYASSPNSLSDSIYFGDKTRFAVRRNRITSHYAFSSPKTADGFTYSDDLSTATIRPGLPFRGSAEYADGAITGDLRFSSISERAISLAPAFADLAPENETDTRCGTPDQQRARQTTLSLLDGTSPIAPPAFRNP